MLSKNNLIRLKNFRGNEFLKDTYSQELDIYLKEKLNHNSLNFISKSLMSFIAIEPSTTNNINIQIEYISTLKRGKQRL